MSDIPSDLKFAKSHEWLRVEGDIAVVGISDHAQAALGDLVFVELPEVGTALSAGAACAVVESVKAASDVYSPASGEVVEVNQTLEDAPETINTDAYNDGWMFKLKLADAGGAAELMDAEAYAKMLEDEDH
jgi:glycine cleavage system H protein